ncbi:hypothetical protein RKD26_004572 [Streptomyces calvus]
MSSRRPGGGAEGAGECGLLLGEGAAGGGEVGERGEDVGGGVGVDVADLHEFSEVAVEGGQVGVELLQVLVQLRQRVAELLAASFQGPGDGRQGRGELVRLDGGEHRQDVVEDLLEFHGVRGAVLGDDGSGGQRFRRRPLRRYERHVALAEEGGRQHLRAHVGRHVVQGAGFQGEGEPGAVVGGVDGADLADDDAAQFHLGARVHLVADAAGLDDHRVGVGEPLVVDGDGQPDQQHGHQQEHHAGAPAAQRLASSAHLTPPPSRSWSRPTGPATGRSR